MEAKAESEEKVKAEVKAETKAEVKLTINKKKDFIINAIYILLILSIIYIVFKYIISLISPFLVALIIAYLLKKPSVYLANKSKIPRKIISFLLVLIFYAIAGVLVSLAGVKLISITSSIFSSLPSMYENQLEPFLLNAFDFIEKTVYRIDPALVSVLNDGFDQFVNSVSSNISNISLVLLSSISDIASSFPAFLIKVLLTVISTFFIAIDFDVLTSYVTKQFSKRGNSILETVKLYMSNTLFVVIRSYAIIMSITFIELSIGLTIIGLKNSILIALVIAFFDILPVLGTGGVMIPWTILTFLQGDYKQAFGLLAVYVFVTIMRNILEPRIVGKQLGIHPVVALMSMFVGANLLGVIGLFGFPITLSLIKHLNDTHKLKILK